MAFIYFCFVFVLFVTSRPIERKRATWKTLMQAFNSTHAVNCAHQGATAVYFFPSTYCQLIWPALPPHCIVPEGAS